MKWVAYFGTWRVSGLRLNRDDKKCDETEVNFVKSSAENSEDAYMFGHQNKCELLVLDIISFVMIQSFFNNAMHIR